MYDVERREVGAMWVLCAPCAHGHNGLIEDREEKSYSQRRKEISQTRTRTTHTEPNHNIKTISFFIKSIKPEML